MWRPFLLQSRCDTLRIHLECLKLQQCASWFVATFVAKIAGSRQNDLFFFYTPTRLRRLLCETSLDDAKCANVERTGGGAHPTRVPCDPSVEMTSLVELKATLDLFQRSRTECPPSSALVLPFLPTPGRSSGMTN